MLFQVDAFADGPFTGNPAAVCLMTEPACDDWLQNVAMEMNLSETAFVWRTDGGFHIRWMTPETEVDLCGHATLASAWAMKEAGWANDGDTVTFQSRSGPLRATLAGPTVELDFPTRIPLQQDVVPDVLSGLGLSDVTWFGKNEYDYFVQLPSEAAVHGCHPDLVCLSQFDVRGIIITAQADAERKYDFVSRFFAPGCGVPEDPVTGSAHVALSPFWAQRLGRNQLTGYQASRRGGTVITELAGDRVKLRGQAITVFRGQLSIDVL